ncbi:MAG TPA: sigma-70 family RNA polymerase sigma factor [Thermoleophilaceae bacterium]
MQEAIRHGGRAADDRPTREEISPAARALVERHSGQLIATARRYSLSAEDAEDAYQRGLEILLTRAPSVSEDDLVPWLKTVVKHEAFAIQKQRKRAELAGDSELASGFVPPTHEQAERFERLRVGIEAMSRLKPQEVRCLLLRAEGYSYRQICDETGFTYTKVNRCLTEGRRRFLDRVAGIESGAECERLAPLLSRLVDGEATAEDMSALRPHLRSCLACRAALRDHRAAPARVAAFAPLLVPGFLHRLGRFFGHLGMQKTAAVVAVAGALVGGGAVVVSSHDSPPAPPQQSRVAPRPTVVHKKKQLRVRRHPRAHAAHSVKRRIAARAQAPVAAPAPRPTPGPAPAPAPVPATPAPAPKPSSSTSEFGP